MSNVRRQCWGLLWMLVVVGKWGGGKLVGPRETRKSICHAVLPIFYCCCCCCAFLFFGCENVLFVMDAVNGIPCDCHCQQHINERKWAEWNDNEWKVIRMSAIFLQFFIRIFGFSQVLSHLSHYHQAIFNKGCSTKNKHAFFTIFLWLMFAH